MLDPFLQAAARFSLDVAPEQRRPIALVGAGGIVEVAHLPAYRRAGLEVVGIYDLDQERSSILAARHGIPRVYPTLEALLEDPYVAVVDIAVLPEAQPEIALRALEAGKAVLCQKPLALNLEAAQAIAQRAKTLGLPVVVNQQLRYSESLTVARALVEQGAIGEPTFMRFEVDVLTDWTRWPWLAQSPQLEIRYHSIHYLDAVRALFGNPEQVFCMAARSLTQQVQGETRTISSLIYPGTRRALVTANHENPGGDPRAEFRIDGTGGAIRGTLGLMYDYPHGRLDTLELRSQHTGGWLPYPVSTRWIPDAFAGPMKALLTSLHSGSEAPSSARDNLGTVRLLEALYQSMNLGQSVHL